MAEAIRGRVEILVEVRQDSSDRSGQMGLRTAVCANSKPSATKQDGWYVLKGALVLETPETSLGFGRMWRNPVCRGRMCRNCEDLFRPRSMREKRKAT
jgi:hypothetical protein